MKDAVSCEKLRGVANRLRSVGVRMWEHTSISLLVSIHEYIVYEKGTLGTEPSKYQEEKKVN